MMHYAASMASRTQSDIVALSLDEKGSDFDQFCKQATTHVTAFARKAQDMGLKFSHLVLQGQEESVLDTLYAQDAGYRYVMDDLPALTGKTRSIPVYSRVSLRAG
jgi:carboxypeptidase C (cathepsin A)